MLWVRLVDGLGHRLGIAPSQHHEDRGHEAKAENHGRAANGCHVAYQADETCSQNPGCRGRAVRLLKLHERHCTRCPGGTLFGSAHAGTRSGLSNDFEAALERHRGSVWLPILLSSAARLLNVIAVSG